MIKSIYPHLGYPGAKPEFNGIRVMLYSEDEHFLAPFATELHYRYVVEEDPLPLEIFGQILSIASHLSSSIFHVWSHSSNLIKKHLKCLVKYAFSFIWITSPFFVTHISMISSSSMLIRSIIKVIHSSIELLLTNYCSDGLYFIWVVCAQ